jgi:hypothetical protein
VLTDIRTLDQAAVALICVGIKQSQGCVRTIELIQLGGHDRKMVSWWNESVSTLRTRTGVHNEKDDRLLRLQLSLMRGTF